MAVPIVDDPAPPPGEAGDAYVFVDRDEFLARAAAGGFLEQTEFPGTGHLYGTPTLEAPAGRDVVLEIDVEGARQVKARYPDAVVVLIVAPSSASQEARLRARGDDEDHVRRRLEVGATEEAAGRRLADRWSSTTTWTGPPPRSPVYSQGIARISAEPGRACRWPIAAPP